MTFIDDSTAANIKEIPRLDWDTKFTATGFAYRSLLVKDLPLTVLLPPMILDQDLFTVQTPMLFTA